ncbi:RHS repeat-associated core domain-containing protein [Streptococcus acidominimus]|uniref:RHS repeat-associated core domain-containing protein n=2 Tax=Streptococcus acidominimus TaxID=1326 RepID=UPI001D16ABC9|nr:RHS repeat-associated core domain-containing protein [Streptococcus acidominimus]
MENKNGNHISQSKNHEQLDYLYDTENRLLAVKDKQGLLMAALYDGDDNRVFTASRKEGKHTYQLFKREEKKKSPYTAPAGEEHSLFWYGFSQNVLQALSSLPQTVGTIWHEIFDDVSIAYHKKVEKDRANEEGLVVNPPSIGDLPGEGEVTYSSQVKEVLIPYTTREDSFNYYEERNYVNDVNRQHTEVLQTYDRELKAKETYTYGHGRTSYHNHETNDHYNYLTNQSGSVTGLTKEGEAVASTSYNLYGSTTRTTDETGNPFAYNGEARDITGLDYLRARYYDSQAGTFLTEDSYQGQLTNPLSQNRYAYVHNNPVNYTDPSGHVRKRGTKSKKAKKTKKTETLYPIFPSGTSILDQQRIIADTQKAKGLIEAQKRFIQETKGHVYNPLPTILQDPLAPSHSPIDYGSTPFATISQAYINAVLAPPPSAYEQAVQSGQSTYGWDKSKSREAQNIHRNWTKALEETIRHVCEVATKANGGTTVHARTISFDSSQTTTANDFKQNLQNQYGFDSETATIMWKIYQNIKATEGKNANYVFNRIIGGVSYPGILWSETAGQPYTQSEIMKKYSITAKDYDKLYVQLKLQHGISGDNRDNYQYADAIQDLIQNYQNQGFSLSVSEARHAIQNMIGKNDFTHQSITVATHLYDKPRLADMIGKLNGKNGQATHTFTNELSGWRGDVTGQALAQPSQGVDDYQADLDAANIVWLMQQGGMDYSGASNEYYYMLNNTNTTREKIFNQSVGIDYVRKELFHAEKVNSMEELVSKNPVAYDFLLKLEAGK